MSNKIDTSKFADMDLTGDLAGAKWIFIDAPEDGKVSRYNVRLVGADYTPGTTGGKAPSARLTVVALTSGYQAEVGDERTIWLAPRGQFGADNFAKDLGGLLNAISNGAYESADGEGRKEMLAELFTATDLSEEEVNLQILVFRPEVKKEPGTFYKMTNVRWAPISE